MDITDLILFNILVFFKENIVKSSLSNKAKKIKKYKTFKKSKKSKKSKKLVNYLKYEIGANNLREVVTERVLIRLIGDIRAYMLINILLVDNKFMIFNIDKKKTLKKNIMLLIKTIMEKKLNNGELAFRIILFIDYIKYFGSNSTLLRYIEKDITKLVMMLDDGIVIDFISAQGILGLCYYINSNISVISKTKIFIKLEKFVIRYINGFNHNKYDSFLLNWVSQALCLFYILKYNINSLLKRKILLLLKKFIPPLVYDMNSKQSITLTACCMEGLLDIRHIIYKNPLYLNKVRLIDESINNTLLWFYLKQKEYKTGGFKYYDKSDTYRVDVTSHVVMCLYKYKSQNF